MYLVVYAVLAKHYKHRERDRHITIYIGGGTGGGKGGSSPPKFESGGAEPLHFVQIVTHAAINDVDYKQQSIQVSAYGFVFEVPYSALNSSLPRALKWLKM